MRSIALVILLLLSSCSALSSSQLAPTETASPAPDLYRIELDKRLETYWFTSNLFDAQYHRFETDRSIISDPGWQADMANATAQHQTAISDLQNIPGITDKYKNTDLAAKALAADALALQNHYLNAVENNESVSSAIVSETLSRIIQDLEFLNAELDTVK